MRTTRIFLKVEPAGNVNNFLQKTRPKNPSRPARWNARLARWNEKCRLGLWKAGNVLKTNVFCKKHVQKIRVRHLRKRCEMSCSLGGPTRIFLKVEPAGNVSKSTIFCKKHVQKIRVGRHAGMRFGIPAWAFKILKSESASRRTRDSPGPPHQRPQQWILFRIPC